METEVIPSEITEHPKPVIVPTVPLAEKKGKRYLVMNNDLSMLERATILRNHYVELVMYKDELHSAILLEMERESMPETLTEEERDEVHFLTGTSPEGLTIFEDFIESPEPCLLFDKDVP
ncbi:hypothetical protein F4Y59_03830 [Candidatus Poribacteria bacterium]|nr:hypothetical protein [Candidatus Poribacteria bacterium]